MNDTTARTTVRPTCPRTHHPHRRPLWTVLSVLVCAVVLLLTSGSAASADSASTGNDVQVAQTLGDRELTVILRRITGVPGPLHVDVITHKGTAAGRIKLAVVPTGVSTSASKGKESGTTVDTAVVKLGSTPGSYSAQMNVDEVGPWELTLDDGAGHTAKIPFVVSKTVTSPAEKAVYVGFIGAGALMLVTVVVAVRVRRGWWTFVPSGGVLACLAVAVTGAVLSSGLPLPVSQGVQVDATIDGVGNPYTSVVQQAAEYSRPPVTMLLSSSTTRAGETDTLTLKLTDSSTGLAVDDLVVHDGALVHLLVVGPSGQLYHLHPVMTEYGTFEVQLPLPEAGHYAVSAEFARRGGGVQEVRSATGIDATGSTKSAAGTLLTQTGTGTRTVDGIRVGMPASSLVAGKAAVLTARIGDSATLQPWLGMLGHMIVVGPLRARTAAVGEETQNAEVWAHSHSMGAVSDSSSDGMSGMAGMEGMDHSSSSSSSSSLDMDSMSGLTSVNGDSTADETVAAYGPDISFVYTFPTEGYYRIWIQAERDNTIITVPYLLHVTDATTEKTR
ncbi:MULTISPECIES: hypothetical protein [unclassified Streptomyces]|uniref:hypothetical protein n=1 Tax=unclassified Streptomyces TaxID=2593676 RepID=UPI00342B2E8E